MIKLENIKFAYSQSVPLFNDLSLELNSGRIYGLLGKNGTGKSTLIKIMSGVLKPQQGSCSANEHIAFNRSVSFLQEIFVVPEEFYLPSITMEQYVKINSPFYPKFDYDNYSKYKSEFELKGNANLNHLSFGQKKKFLLSFGLATNVRVLFLDEPTNGLDIPSKSQLRKSIANTLHEDCSIIISTHQARDLESLIDTILIVENGKIIFNQSYDNVTDQLAFEKALVIDDEEGILYKEEALGGYRVVKKAKPNQVSHLDLELLFNAVVNNATAFNEHLNN